MQNYKIESHKQKNMFYLKAQADPDLAKTAHVNRTLQIYIALYDTTQMYTQTKNP